ncbi:MAG: hypothetical protein WD063_16055 [Pirellulales bacterium]
MQGEVVYLYAFDVANEIVTAKIGEILATRPAPFEMRATHTVPKDLPLYKPLVIEPPPLATALGQKTVRLVVRIYDVGVVSVAMRVAVACDNVAELSPFHAPRLEDGRSFDAAARELCAEVYKSLRDVLIHPAPPHEPEAYTVFCLTELGGETNAPAWLARERRAVAELLTESTPGTLAEMQVGEVLRVSRSYAETDAIVIDWDAALVVDLDGYVDDVLYVLELANLQLEEYRVMDQRLDRYLDRVYDDLNRRRFGLFGTYSRTLGALRLIRVDVTRLNDEVTHISKFFGDWYLARVYLGAAERFYLSQWRQSVENRLGHLDELYSVVNADINNRRMVWLELLIVIFFAIDLVMLALKN